MIDENVITEENTEAVEETEEKVDREVVFEEALEAILFAAGHPISYSTLARVFNTTPAKVKDLVFEYSLKYNSTDLPRGVILLTYSDSCQLCTKKDYYEYLIRVAKQPKKYVLTDVLLETMAIVAYKQPVTRLEIEKIRGVKSDHPINKLLEYGLIQELGRLDAPGRPIVFGTTEEFLRNFGVSSVSELPTISPDRMAEIQEEAEHEAVEQQKNK